jgi:hypothetical protein
VGVRTSKHEESSIGLFGKPERILKLERDTSPNLLLELLRLDERLAMSAAEPLSGSRRRTPVPLEHCDEQGTDGDGDEDGNGGE